MLTCNAMTTMGRRLRATSILGGAVALALSGASGVAVAQDGTEVEEIVVTGSRLVRTDLNAPSPTTMIGEDEFAYSGGTTVETVINRLPQLSGGTTSNVNSGGGSGVLTANLRGLGANRTLTLVNGRRFMAANGSGNVDLGTIPGALVQRVEIITGGASAVYGSDAIAGVVNFTLRDDIDGIEASYQYGESGEGDAGSHKYDLTFGTPFADGLGSIVLHVNYTEREGVMMGARGFSRIPLDSGTMGITGSGNIPGGRMALSAAQLAALDVGAGPGVLPRSATCTVPQTAIRFGENGEVFQYCTPEDVYNYADSNFLLRPFEREQFVGLASYEIAPSVEAYSELHYINTKNEYQQAPDALNLVTPGETYLEVVNYATNMALPAAVRQLLVDNPAIFDPEGTGDARIAGGIQRRFDELSPRNFSFDRTAVGATGGLRGEFEFGDNWWRWDVFGQLQRAETDQLTRGTMSTVRLLLGLDTVVNDAGEVVCANPILGCVTVNPFGLGSITPEAAAFITPHRSSTEQFERTVLGASLAGDLFELPAGPVSTAIGVEYRDDSYEFVPGATDLSREYGDNSEGVTLGGYDVSEVFGEFRVPLLSGAAYADSLALEGAVRYSDYSNFDGATTWKVGLEWAPNDWLRFRTAYNEANRAPSISELYSPVTLGFTGGIDPCAAAANPTDAQKQLCIEQGVPADAVDNFVPTVIGFNERSGGNPDLQDERSETFTLGFVAQVPWVDRLNVSLDYFNIEVTDAVAALDATDTLRTCFELLDINSAPCQAITRIPSNGEVFLVDASSSNIGSLTAEGMDLSADWSTPLPDSLGLFGDVADLGLVLHANWMFERVTQVVGAAPVDCAGYYGSCTRQGGGGTPSFSAVLSADYASGPLTLRNQIRYVGALDPMPGIGAPPVNAGSTAYWDLTASYDFTDEVQLFGGINNVLDQEPRILGQAYGGDSNTDVTLYDPIGRYGFIGIRTHF